LPVPGLAREWKCVFQNSLRTASRLLVLRRCNRQARHYRRCVNGLPENYVKFECKAGAFPRRNARRRRNSHYPHRINQFSRHNI
jgi:hypothetical protein